MNVRQAYGTYQTPQNLQEHMLRVSSVARVVLEHWIGPPVDKEAIVKACTIHDIAKPMNFDPDKQAQFGMPDDKIEELRQLQNRLRTAYGEDEHHATVGICKEIGCSPIVVSLVDNLEWKYIPRLLAAKDTASLVPIYCDMRVGPKGILSLQARLEELKNRVSADDYEDKVVNGSAIEEELANNTSIDLNGITDAQVHSGWQELLALEF